MTSDQDVELDLRHLVGVLWRRAWVVALLAVLGAAAGYVWAARQPDLYAATAQVQVRDPNAALFGLSNVPAGAAGDREVNTQLEFIRSTEVRQAAQALLGSTDAPVQSMSPSNVSGTDLIDVRVVSRSPEVAQRAANAYAEAYVATRKQQLTQVLEDQAADRRARADELTQRIAAIDVELAAGADLSQAEQDSLSTERQGALAQRAALQETAQEFEINASTKSAGVLVVEPAALPGAPFAPTPLRNAALGGVLGLLLGVGLVFLLERLDDRVGSPEQVERLTGGVPVLGAIPIHEGARRWGRRALPHGPRSLVPLDSPVAEAYRTLQTSIRFSSLGKSKQTLLVTSSVSGEGKSTCTANLAAMLADSGLRVVVISADLRKPMVASIFGVPETVRGLTSVLLGDATLAESLVPVGIDNGKQVYVLPAGPVPHNPTELLGSRAFGAMLREIEEAGADFILVDCAPVLPVSDPLAAAQHVDGVLVLAVAGRSKRDNLVEAVSRLRQVEADVIGVVLNGVPTRGSGYSYYYRYGYGSTPPPKAPPAPPASRATGSANGSSNGAHGPGPMGIPGQAHLPGT